jgi:hypothetical protein
MSTGFAHSKRDDSARGFERGHSAVADARQFKAMALRLCHGLIAHIERAENFQPGTTNDALDHARAARDALTRPAFLQAPPVVVPKDEEE